MFIVFFPSSSYSTHSLPITIQICMAYPEDCIEFVCLEVLKEPTEKAIKEGVEIPWESGGYCTIV